MSNPQAGKKKAYVPFQILEPMTDPPEDVLNFSRAFIAKSRWIFAKTMPEHPHEYVLRRDCYARGYEHEFVEMVELIRRHGYAGRFYKTRLVYMNVDGWRYWSMGAPIPETILINRAINDDMPTPCCALSIATGGKHHARNCRNSPVSAA